MGSSVKAMLCITFRKKHSTPNPMIASVPQRGLSIVSEHIVTPCGVLPWVGRVGSTAFHRFTRQES